MTATLYSKPACVQCDATKRWFKKRGLTIHTVDITEDPAALEHVLGLGYQQAPVVVVDGDHWSGFNPLKLDEHFPKENAA